MTTVVSGFNPQGYRTYGHQFLKTFDQFWPKDFKLVVYVEEKVPWAGRAEQRLLSSIPGVEEFIAKHQGDPVKCGKQGTEYNFRFDAVKFCRQCFIPHHAALSLPDDEVLVWMDADVVTFNKVPDNLVQIMLADHEICYLGRPPKHSELGFWAVRLGHYPRAFLKRFADTYREDSVFELKEWHSAFVFDHCRSLYPGMRQRNVTPNGRGHVWFQSPLGAFSDHLKGKRKLAGRSPERR